MNFSSQFLDELRARTSLSTLIGRSVSLKKVGREHKACCPFHNEKSPSFWVNDDKAFYHCFGCGAHGDAIRFLTEHNGLPFVDAVKELAAAAGMEIPASDPRQAERDREFAEMREIMARAARHYRDRREHALDYLRGRGIDDAISAIFEIGAAPRPNRAPPLHEAMKDVPVEKLIGLGLVKRREEGERAGEIYDTFRNRVMFPIHDARGRVIGFGGRIIGQGEPKYLNSPDTPLFDKGRTLFNAHRASPAAHKANRLVIVEGYMDVVALYRAGVTETVAPNGTALTEHQITLAWRMADVPILCFDGDKAGRAAMGRAAIRALPMLEPGKSLSFVIPPAGKDPDDLLRDDGAEAVQALFVKPTALVDTLWSFERDREPCNTPEQVAGLKTRMREHVRSIRNSDVREAYGQAIAKRFAQTFDAQAQGVTGGSSPQIRSTPTDRPSFRRAQALVPASAAQRQIGRTGMSRDVEHAILLGLSRFPDVAVDHLEALALARFQDTKLAALRDALVSAILAAAPAATLAGLLADNGLEQPLRPLLFSFARTGADPARAREDLERSLYALAQR